MGEILSTDPCPKVNPDCAKPKQVRTIRTNLDEEIKRARERVENLCIAKAKAETLGILDYPHKEVVKILGNWY